MHNRLQGFSKDYQPVSDGVLVDLRMLLKTCRPTRPCTVRRHWLTFALQVVEILEFHLLSLLRNVQLGRFRSATLTASELCKFPTHATLPFPQEWRSMWTTRIITSINLIVFHESSNFMQLPFHYGLTHCCVFMSIHRRANLPPCHSIFLIINK